MCLGLIPCLIEFLPYLALVLLPLVGAFLGVEVVLRVSLLLCLHAAVINLVPQPWVHVLPYLQAVVFMALAVFPMLWLPWQLVWLYGAVLWLTEPLLLVAEVVLVQNVVMRCGQHLAEKIDDDEDASLCKGVIIVFSAACYALAGSGAWELYKNNTPLQNGFLLVVVLLFVAVHNMFWMAREGVISDAAFCTLCMVWVLGAMSVETGHIRHPIAEPSEWSSEESTSSRAVDTIASVLYIETGSRGVDFLLNVVVTPFFFLSLVIRLFSIIFIVSKVTKNFFMYEELSQLDEDELLDPMAPWRSPLLLKLSLIFMLTQLTALLLWQASGHYMATLASWAPAVATQQAVWPQQLLLGRGGQVVAVCAFYVWRLYCADAWTWCEWLTP
ncbi:uncharacterized protein LOC143288176 [Babylonia areolata]|uniref:uncharacterized protein LOC143288176 n=1 Tax=Babylonia areolata TaxID=304850 RepID=UPI003FD6B77B